MRGTLQLEPAIAKDDLLKLFQFLDPDGGNTIEVEDIELVFEVSAGKSREAGYAQEQAFLLLGDVAGAHLCLALLLALLGQKYLLSLLVQTYKVYKV